MTLEDFFTLTEMKNGLTNCARVEELICVIQKLNCVTNNVGDSARQWSTAATTLACTQNRECLNLFVHLNGLGFLNHWLQEAVKCSRDFADGEELITTLIGSLDNLPTNPESLSSSGIFATVEKLFGHTNVNIKDRARMLFDKWNNRRANDNSCVGEDGSYPLDNFEPSIDNHVVDEAVDNSSCQTADEGLGENLPLTSENDPRLGDVKYLSIENEHHTLPLTTLVSEDGRENSSVQEGNFLPKAEMEISTATASPEIQVEDDEKAEVNKREGDSWEFRETSILLSSHTKNPKVVRSASCNLTLNEGKPILLDAKEALHRCASVDGVRPEYSKTVDGVWPEYSKTTKEVNSDEHDSTDIPDSSSKESSSRNEAAENTGDIGHCNEPFIDDDPYKTSTRKMETSSDSEPESVEMDALEIARLVAIEVEREVVDYREELCSSSPETSSNEIMNTTSPIIGEANGNESVLIKDDCDVTSAPKDDNHMIEEMATDLSKQNKSLESPNGAAIIQESRPRDFDLNEDACTEDIDIDCSVNPIQPNNLINFSAPIAVSASKGAPLFLITPQYFEGGLGWKGSAATSAFRPASPRRAFDGEKSESVSKCKANLIELDLNLTDCENYLPVETVSIKEAPVSSSIPSWNSSSEVSSMRAERIKLDLNSNGEDEATPSVKHHFINVEQSSSPTSSSSSLKQPPPPPRKNFDLNDNLFSSDAAVSKNIISLSDAANPHGIKLDDPAITIMGSRMSAAAERRGAHTNQMHHPSFIENGLSFDSTLPTGPMLPYHQHHHHQIPHPSYRYIAPGTGTALPFQPTVYGFGNVPHMVDSRGATIIPQLMNSAGANGTTTPLAATLPYLMSMRNAATPSSSNGGGPSHPGLDLNFGIMQMESGSTEMEVLKPPLMEEQVNSGNSLKRKEPESGWESYSFGYKHLASWH